MATKPSKPESRKPPKRPKPKRRAVSLESRGVLLLDPSVRLPVVSLKRFKNPLPYRLAGGNLRFRDKELAAILKQRKEDETLLQLQKQSLSEENG